MMDIPSSRVWLDRFKHPLPIRARGTFHLLSATRCSDGKQCVVLLPSPSAPDAARLLPDILRAHNLVDHPAVPKITAHRSASGVPYLELDCDATIDGIELCELLQSAPCPIPFAFADGFLATLHDAIKSAHAVRDPVLDCPVCLGRLTEANVLFARSGRFFLIGYGQPDDGAAERDKPDPLRGELPSPAADRAALLLFARRFLPLVDLTPFVVRLLCSPAGPVEAALEDCLYSMRDLLAALPAVPSSSTFAEAEQIMARLRMLSGLVPEPKGFEDFIRRLLEQQIADGRALLSAPGDSLEPTG